MTPPREVPSWDEFYLGLAYMCASKSKDPSTQCGALIVDPQQIPLGFGCNGAPRQMKDAKIDWSRPNKYAYVLHAEENAINHCRMADVNGLKGCTLYVTGHPCSKCMLRIVSKGIGRVCHGPLLIHLVDEGETALSKKIAADGGVKVDMFDGKLNWVSERYRFMGELGLFQ